MAVGESHLDRLWRNDLPTCTKSIGVRPCFCVAFGEVLSGWPGDYIFEAHRAGTVTLQLEVGCVASGTYTDFTFTLRPFSQDHSTLEKPLLQIWQWGASEGGGTLKYRYTTSGTALPGMYQLTSFLNGYLGGLCPWSLTLTRPG
jgi:hypothetical protein